VKKLLPYIVLFLGSTVAATLVFAIIAFLSPQLLHPKVNPSVAAGDSSAAHRMGKDTTAAGTMKAAGDSTAGADGTEDDSRAPALAQQGPDTATMSRTPADRPSPQSGVSAADSVRAQEKKNLAKVFEAMEPARAAAILKNLSDEEVRSTILALKRRQAAKILAALDPDRVARIMR
jgi:hypothetical protein